MPAWLEEWLTGVEPILHQYGLAGLFTSVFLESMGLPLPGETMLIIAGTLAGAGKVKFFTVGLTAFTAAVLGDNVGYLIGRFGGRPLMIRHGARIGITHTRMAWVEGVIRRRGMLIVALAQFVVLLRQLNGLAAGTTGMQWSRFLLANVIGAALWVAVWLALAFQLGSSIHIIPYLLRHLSWVAAVLLPVLLLGGVCGWWVMCRRGTSGSNV